jgi:hypothetical protein
MEALVTFFGGAAPYLVIAFGAIAALFGARQWGKSVGKSEARAEQAEKVQEQAAAAEREVQNADRKVDAASDPAAGLRDNGWVRKPPAGGK